MPLDPTPLTVLDASGSRFISWMLMALIGREQNRVHI